MRRTLTVLLPCLLLAVPLSAATLVLPEIAVEVLDETTGEPVPGARVELLAGKKNDLRPVAEGRTGSDGWVAFGPQGERDLKYAAVRVTWEVPSKPARRLVYRFKTKKGEKTSRGRLAEPGKSDAFYALAGEYEGDCENLFHMMRRGDRYEIRFRRPATYERCQQAHFKNADMTNIGARDINGSAVNLFSFTDDVAMGLDFTRQMGPDQPVLDDPLIQNYVTDLIQRIGRVSDMPDLEFHVQVIDADVLNAFALPGGYTFVYRGLLDEAETEAELVGVLAHEIAHVTGRHGTEGVTSSMAKMAAALVIGGLIAEEVSDDPDTRNLIMNLALTGTNFWVMGGTRKREAEADRLGAQYALRAGYDPRGLASFFEKLKAKGGTASRLDVLMSDHPSDDARIHNVNEMWDYFLPPTDRQLTTTSVEFMSMKKRLAQLPPAKLAGPGAANALFNSFKAANEELIWKQFMDYEAANNDEEDQ